MVQKNLVVVLVGILMSGCAHYFRNAVMLPTDYDPNSGYRYANVRTRTIDQDRHQASASKPLDTFIVLAFSGGGTRAAALAYGVLKELHSSRFVISDGTERTLLDEVDVIASVSGGSFTAAYYGLYGDQIFSPHHTDASTTDFKKKVLHRRIETALLLKLFNPWNWVRLASP